MLNFKDTDVFHWGLNTSGWGGILVDLAVGCQQEAHGIFSQHLGLSTGTSQHETCLLQPHQTRSKSSTQIFESLSSPEPPNLAVRGALMFPGVLSEGLRMFAAVEGCSAGSRGRRG